MEVWQRPATVEVAAFLGQDVLVDPSMVTGGSSAWQAAAVGAEAVVVRPEAVVLGTASGAGTNGIITEVTFEGDRTVMVVEVPGMPPLRAVAQAVPPQVGDRVGVTIDVAGTWPVRSTGRQSASSPTGHDTPVPPRPQ